MSVKSVSSRANDDYRALLTLACEPRSRRRLRRTLLDGEHLLTEALAAGLRPRRLIYAYGHQARAEHWQARMPDVPAMCLADALFATLSPVDTPSGILAEIDIPDARGRPDDGAVLLERVQDPGNLGAILRVAAAAGVGTVMMSAGCAEAWSPKCLRGAQGAHFRLDIVERVALADAIAALALPVYAASLGAARELYQLDLRAPAAFLFGNEGAGLSETLLQRSTPFRIPMPGGMESLNVATAAAVCLFERVRQRRVPEMSAPVS